MVEQHTWLRCSRLRGGGGKASLQQGCGRAAGSEVARLGGVVGAGEPCETPAAIPPGPAVCEMHVK
jgi:hypothetical protein